MKLRLLCVIADGEESRRREWPRSLVAFAPRDDKVSMKLCSSAAGPSVWQEKAVSPEHAVTGTVAFTEDIDLARLVVPRSFPIALPFGLKSEGSAHRQAVTVLQVG
jgi:hypothetical protein